MAKPTGARKSGKVTIEARQENCSGKSEIDSESESKIKFEFESESDSGIGVRV